MPTKLRPLRFLLNGPRAKPRLALGIALSVLAATAAWSFTRPKIYEATASVMLEGMISSMSICCLGEYDSGNQSMSDTDRFALEELLEIGGSRFIARAAASRVGQLDAWPIKDVWPSFRGIPSDLMNIRRVSISGDGTKLYLHYTVRTPTPHSSADMANNFASAFWEHYKNQGVGNGLIVARNVEALATAQRERIILLEKEPPDTPDSAKTLELNREVLAQIDARILEIKASLENLERRQPLVIPAEIPAADAYVSPNHPLNLALGLLAGLALGTLVSTLATRRAAREPGPSASET